MGDVDESSMLSLVGHYFRSPSLLSSASPTSSSLPFSFSSALLSIASSYASSSSGDKAVSISCTTTLSLSTWNWLDAEGGLVCLFLDDGLFVCRLLGRPGLGYLFSELALDHFQG